MSLYWMYVGDQWQPVIQPVNQPLIGQPSGSSKMIDNLTNQMLLANKMINPLGLASPADLKLNLAFIPGFLDKPDTKHFHIFVGDLCPNLDLQMLQDAFSPYGQVSDCKIIQDPQTLKSKGYGFVTFVKKDDAERAIKQMNGQYIGSRAIRTNWAIRKGSSHLDGGRSFNYEDILSQPASCNCTVYCGGIMTDLTEEVIQKKFCVFGDIVEIRIFQEKGYAFIRFSNKEDAARAIIETHLTEVAGHVVKCSWGKKAEEAQPTYIPAFAQLLQPQPLLRPTIPPPSTPTLPSASHTPAFTFLNQQQQCYGGLPISPYGGAATSTTAPFNAVDYYVCPTTSEPYSKSLLESAFNQQLIQQQQPQQQQQQAIFSHIPMQSLLPNVQNLPPPNTAVNFPTSGLVYTVP